MSVLDFVTDQFFRLKRLVGGKTRVGAKELGALTARLADTTARGLEKQLKEQGVDATQAQWLDAYIETQIAFYCRACEHLAVTLRDERLWAFAAALEKEMAAFEGPIGLIFQDGEAVERGKDIYLRRELDEQTRTDYADGRWAMSLPEYRWPGTLSVRVARCLAVDMKGPVFWSLCMSLSESAISMKQHVFNDTLVPES